MTEPATLDDISADVFRVGELLGAMFDDLMQSPMEGDEGNKRWSRAEAIVVAARMLNAKVLADIEAMPRGKAVAA